MRPVRDSMGLERFGQGAWDAAHVPGLLGQSEGVIGSATADGAFDGEPAHGASPCGNPRGFACS
jgi:hypothetical protein